MLPPCRGEAQEPRRRPEEREVEQKEALLPENVFEHAIGNLTKNRGTYLQDKIQRLSVLMNRFHSSEGYS